MPLALPAPNMVGPGGPGGGYGDPHGAAAGPTGGYGAPHPPFGGPSPMGGVFGAPGYGQY